MAVRPGRSRRRIHLLVGLLLVLLALPLAYLSWTRCMDKLASPSWPLARAEVLSFDMRKRVKSGAWCAELSYQYLVGRDSFRSSRWSLSTKVACYRDRQVADTLSRRFQPGAGILVRHDPADPEKAIVYLDDVGFSDFLFLILAGLFLPVGILLIKGKAGQGGNEEQRTLRLVHRP